MAEGSLKPGLQNRHVSMIAIGGVIGAGLFVGSGAGIHATGPGILVSYTIAGVLVVLVMRMLGEMAAASPETGSFSAYADRAVGRWAGLTVGWLYWWFWTVTLAVEATAGAVIVHSWIPAIPQWALALVLMILLTATNLFSVASYGEFEFWFSSIKVAAIAVFIVLGVLAIFGVIGHGAPGMTNLTGHGGFFPKGYGAVITGLLTVVFAFGGSEIATIAASESKNPGQAVTKAINSVVWRILVFYIGSMAVVITLLPWNAGEIGKSPYVAVLNTIGIGGAGHIMDVIVLTAVLSCLNSGLYTASRMTFSLAERGDAPKAFARTTARGVPRNAILASVVFGFVAMFFNYTSPKTVFMFLLNSSGAIQLFVWLVIAISQLLLRRRTRELPVRMWLYPYLTIATIAGIVAVLVVMLFDHDGRPQVLWSIAIAAVIIVAGLIKHGPAREEIAPPLEATAADR